MCLASGTAGIPASCNVLALFLEGEPGDSACRSAIRSAMRENDLERCNGFGLVLAGTVGGDCVSAMVSKVAVALFHSVLFRGGEPPGGSSEVSCYTSPGRRRALISASRRRRARGSGGSLNRLPWDVKFDRMLNRYGLQFPGCSVSRLTSPECRHYLNQDGGVAWPWRGARERHVKRSTPSINESGKRDDGSPKRPPPSVTPGFRLQFHLYTTTYTYKYIYIYTTVYTRYTLVAYLVAIAKFVTTYLSLYRRIYCLNNKLSI